MSFKVEVNKKELSRFRKIALEYYNNSKEYMELLFVQKVPGKKLDKYIIKEFRQLKLKATETSVYFCNTKEFIGHYIEAILRGYELGSIHTHPNQEASPSIKDMKSDVGAQFILSGICSLLPTKNKRVIADFKFWKPQLPGTIHATKIKKSITKKSNLK